MKTRPFNCRAFRGLLFVILFVFQFLACGDGGESTSDVSSDSGSVSFRLLWSNPIGNDPVYLPQSPGGDICDDYEIDTINVSLTDAAGIFVATGSWPCAAHTGTLSEVPVGTGMALTISGVVGGNVDWQAQVSPVSVSSGQNTNLGEVEMVSVSGDKEPPSVTSRYPAEDGADVATNVSIRATFNERVVAASINSSTFTVSKSGLATPIESTVRYNSASLTAKITPIVNLTPSTEYTATLSTAVEDLSGNPLAADESWTFTTGAGESQSLIWDNGNWDATHWN